MQLNRSFLMLCGVIILVFVGIFGYASYEVQKAKAQVKEIQDIYSQ